MPVDAITITRADVEAELAQLREKEAALKRESKRVSDQIMDLRPRKYELVQLMKDMNAQVAS